MRSCPTRRTRRLALLVLASALIVPVAQARAAGGSCCKTRTAPCHSQSAPAPCASLAPLPCCHAAPASSAPASPQHEGSQATQAFAVRPALEAPALASIGLPPAADLPARSAALRLSVVLRI